MTLKYPTALVSSESSADTRLCDGIRFFAVSEGAKIVHGFSVAVGIWLTTFVCLLCAKFRSNLHNSQGDF